jgi:integrase
LQQGTKSNVCLGHWRRFLGLAVAPIEMHTGQRQGDILRLSWSSYDGETVTLKQAATRRGIKPLPIPIRCTKALKKVLDATPRSSPLILTTKTGQGFKKRWFSNVWKSAMIEAGIEDLHFNDVRGTATAILRYASRAAVFPISRMGPVARLPLQRPLRSIPGVDVMCR